MGFLLKEYLIQVYLFAGKPWKRDRSKAGKSVFK